MNLLKETAGINNNNNKMIKKSIYFIRNIKIFCVWKTYNIQANTKRFFRSIKNFHAGKTKKIPKIKRDALQIKQTKTIQPVKKTKKKPDNIKQYFRFLKELSAMRAFRIDLLLILVILVLIISPFFINKIVKTELKTKQINLTLSVRCEELLGSGITSMLLQEFNGQNPDIRLRLHSGQIDGELPDILIFDESEFNRLFTAGVLADISSYYSSEDADTEESEDNQFDDDSRAAAFQFTPRFAIPLVSFMDMLFYNIEILSAAGFDHPPKTREEFLACTRAVSRGNFSGISGATLSLSPEDSQALSRDIFSWIWATGVDFWQEGNKPVLAAPANIRAITGDFTFFGSLNREVQTHGIFEQTGSRRLEEFAQGRVALMITSTRNIPYLRERMGDNTFGITIIPGSGTGGRYSVSLSSIYAGINSAGLHTGEASIQAMSQFLKFLTEKTELFCAELRAVPGSVINPIPGDYVRDDPFYSKAWDIFEISRIVQGFSGKPGAEKYETIFMEELSLFFEGAKTAQQAVTAIQRRWDEVVVPD